MSASVHAAPRPGRLRSLRELSSAVATITVKELRSRMRGRRAFVILTLYLSVLAAIAYGVYLVRAPGARLVADLAPFAGEGLTTSLNASASIGQSIFSMLSLFQLLLVCFIAPAFTAGSISLEREKQTLDLLISTPLRPGGIVLGKLTAALAFVFLMIVAGLPLSALVLMYGGVTVDDLLRQQAVLFASAVGFGAIGLFFSALLKRTQPATVLAYSTMLALTIGTLMVYVFWSQMLVRGAGGSFDPFSSRRAPEALLWPNPAVAMAEVIANTETGASTDFTLFLYELLGPGGEVDPLVLEERGIQLDDAPAQLELERWIAEQERVVRPGAAALDLPAPDACPLGADCDRFEAIAEPSPISNHLWPRFVASLSVISVVVTLASMWLVVPAGMRSPFTRRPRGGAVGMAPIARSTPAGAETAEET